MRTIPETPLSLIAGIRSRPSRMVMALVNGGAILDFRTRDGSTAMHRAVLFFRLNIFLIQVKFFCTRR